jgi:hypothetical protein
LKEEVWRAGLGLDPSASGARTTTANYDANATVSPSTTMMDCNNLADTPRQLELFKFALDRAGSFFSHLCAIEVSNAGLALAVPVLPLYHGRRALLALHSTTHKGA